MRPTPSDSTHLEKQSYHALSLGAAGDYRKLEALLQRYESWTAAYKAQAKDTPEREKSWKQLTDQGIRLIMPSDQEFPELLKEIPWQPHALYALGAVLTNDLKLAIVGTRKATAAGLAIAD